MTWSTSGKPTILSGYGITSSNFEDVLKRLSRSTIGSDRMFLESDTFFDTSSNYPPYNLERFQDESYRLTLAVAGFTRDELTVEVAEGYLTVSGKKPDTSSEEASDQFIHRGIAFRNFERKFKLMEYVEVESSTLDNGILSVTLRRILPDSLKARTIEIK